ncbi:MAG: MopE-related protein [Pseudomonadota bacterium]|nr:MopE-related protein [Pseudomonadota bacterium]
MSNSFTNTAYTARISILALLLAPTSASAYETFGDGAFYLGDLHAHTGYSGDGGSSDFGDCEGTCGSFADVFTTAKDNGLDFVAITDHVNGGAALSAGDFHALTAAVQDAHDPENGFVTLPAGEVWFTMRGTGARLGHKTLLMFGDKAALADLSLADVRIGSGSAVDACEDIWTWMDGLAAEFGPALLLPHHPSVRMPMETDWGCFDATYEPAVEIYSEHGNGLDSGDYDVPGEGIFESSTVLSAMDPDGYGLSFGFVGGTDSHDSKPGGVCDIDTEQPTHLYGGGLTVAVLDPSEAFDRDTLHDAIIGRRTYVTSGPALPMSLQWSSAGTVLGGLGSPLLAPASYDLDVAVSVPSDRAHLVTAVDVVGPDATWSLLDDGAGSWTGSVPAGAVPAWLFVAVEIDGERWYAPDGCADGGDDVEWLWGSPSTISLWEDDADGDGASVLDGDCDDEDPEAYPGAPEAWYDGVDQGCDEGDDFDRDGDGHRALGWGTDCDDTDPDIYTAAVETWYDGVDQDCDGADDYDQDADGERAVGWGGDCDDADPAIFTGAAEIWYDGVDQDCNGESDYDQDTDGEDALSWGGTDCNDTNPKEWSGYPEIWYDGIDEDCDGSDDYDQDGDGDRALVWGGGDCDDTEPTIHSAAVEVWYDGVDQNCDTASDYDQDGDTFDDARGGGADCDDTDADVSPDATELWYDGVDQDCDGTSDHDQDGDGEDAIGSGGLDCDDTDADVSPDATEVWYDGVDQDCDGGSDHDRDGDSFDAQSSGGSDCDDTRADVSPEATEVWYDGLDQDCDGASDWDADGDGADVGGGGDCDDTRADVSPAAIETWYDGVDQDCDGASDYDQDADGVVTPADCFDTDPGAWACPPLPPPTSGCTSVPGTGAGGAGGALLLAALALTRRRAKIS